MPLSGPLWVHQFPASSRIDDLVEPFRTRVQSFLRALSDAGALVEIADTLRPPQRAYLMHFSFQVAKSGLSPSQVPARPDLDIQWVHLDSQGNPDATASLAAAAQMVAGYGIVFAPALDTRHTQGLAIDMTISWAGNLTIRNASGSQVVITDLPHSGSNPHLQRVGASYGVIKLATDPPHWSSDGH